MTSPEGPEAAPQPDAAPQQVPNPGGFALPADASLEEVQEHFKNDRFATQAAGCVLVEAGPGRAVAEMQLKDVHRNAMGNVMGGAIFTLADFALAAACNVGEAPTVSIDSNISYYRASKGEKLTATATCSKPGHHAAFYTIDVVDDLGKQIARMTATCYR